MFGFHRFRAGSDLWVRVVRDGRILREGVGLTVWRFGSDATLMAVPVDLRESGFHSQARSAEGSSIRFHGQVAWRIADPATAAALLDFRVDPDGIAFGRGLDRIEGMLRRELRDRLRESAASRTAEDLRWRRELLAKDLRDTLRLGPLASTIGVEVSSVWLDEDEIPDKVSDPNPPGYHTGVLSSHPLAEAWRRELPLSARLGPRFVGPLD